MHARKEFNAAYIVPLSGKEQKENSPYLHTALCTYIILVYILHFSIYIGKLVSWYR